MRDRKPTIISWTPSDWDCICQLAKLLETTEANFIQEIVATICIDQDGDDLDFLFDQFKLIIAIKKKQKRKLKYSREFIRQYLFPSDPSITGPAIAGNSACLGHSLLTSANRGKDQGEEVLTVGKTTDRNSDSIIFTASDIRGNAPNPCTSTNTPTAVSDTIPSQEGIDLHEPILGRSLQKSRDQWDF